MARAPLHLCVIIGGMLLVAAVAPAGAHGRSTPVGSASGISIPNLTHGQMQVIADNQSAIEDLAERQYPTDPTMRRLQGFAALQKFVCAWGVVPGSVTDEGSPFNECAHAYLAATRALLVHLRTLPGGRIASAELVKKVETEMLYNGASLVLCRYSDEPFNTAEFIMPHLGPIPVDPIAMGTFVAGSALAAWFAARLLRQSRRSRALGRFAEPGRPAAG